VTPDIEMAIGKMAATGIGRRAMSKTLHLDTNTIKDILARPHVAEYVDELRRHIRKVTLAGIAQKQQDVIAWIGETVDQRDATSFDKVTKGAFALEKTAASASGEALRVDARVVSATMNVDEEARQLIAALMSSKSDA